MPRKRYTAEQIIRYLRQAEVLSSCQAPELLRQNPGGLTEK